MKFELNEKVKTNKNEGAVLEILEEQFRKVSDSTRIEGKELIVRSIHASFYSFVCSDKTEVRISKKENGYLCVADTNYCPSIWFWILFILGFFIAGLGTIIDVIAYFYQKKVVRDTIVDVLRGVKNEVED